MNGRLVVAALVVLISGCAARKMEIRREASTIFLWCTQIDWPDVRYKLEQCIKENERFCREHGLEPTCGIIGP